MRTKIFRPLIIIVSLFSISATTKSNVGELKTYKFIFHGTNCSINGDKEFTDTFIAGKTNLKYTIKGVGNYSLPSKEEVTCDIPFDYSKNGVITFQGPLNKNVEVFAATTESHEDTYTFSFVGEGCTINGEDNYSASIPYGKESVKYTIVAPKGKHIIITEGKDLVEFDSNTGFLTIPCMNNDIAIKATTKDVYQINFNGVNCTASGHSQQGALFQLYGEKDMAYEFTLTPNTKHSLPTDLNIKINDQTAIKGEDYEYTPLSAGNYKLSLKLEGNTLINAVAIHETKTFTVTFEPNNGSAVTKKTDITVGSHIDPIADPTNEGYVFGGWYTDDETFKCKFNFAKTPITSDLTLYANWTGATITLDAGEKASVSLSERRYYSFSVRAGIKWGELETERLAEGVKAGYDFLYWTINGSKVTDDTQINDSVELEACYVLTSTQYLTFIPRNDDATLKVYKNGKNLQYMVEGSTFIDVNEDTDVTVNLGTRIFFKGNNTTAIDVVLFGSDDSSYFDVSGQSNSIINNATSLLTSSFKSLFGGFSNLICAHNLSLSYGTLTENCFYGMFMNCSSLVTAPDLPSTKLAGYCYDNMFSGCASLTQAPELPAISLAKFCYSNMFYCCTSLAVAPNLPATTLATNCYTAMFSGCLSLGVAPELPATTLADSCYSSMFLGCNALVATPNLPATTLANRCYLQMFHSCDSLTCVSELSATVLQQFCYQNMFNDCKKLNISERSGLHKLVSFPDDVDTNEYAVDMFAFTAGSFAGTPKAGTSYYWN